MVDRQKVKDLFEADPTMPIILYELDLQDRGMYYFHAGENGFLNKIVFDAKAYDYYPIEVEGFDFQGDGRLPRPKMTLANFRGNVSIRLPIFNDFINYKLERVKTLVKYLDHVNFPNNVNPHAEPDNEEVFAREIYFVNQKLAETDSLVQFELVSPLELENSEIPSRTIYSNYCGWRYRSSIGCGYNGRPIADKKNKRFVESGYEGDGVGGEVHLTNEDMSNPDINITDFAATGDVVGDYPEWSPYEEYMSGDVVKRISRKGDAELYPETIYVCVGSGVQSNPLFDKKNWIEDSCDNSLCGCRMRFSDDAENAGGCHRKRGSSKFRDVNQKYKESSHGLPFGAFPGVEPYDFK